MFPGWKSHHNMKGTATSQISQLPQKQSIHWFVAVIQTNTCNTAECACSLSSTTSIVMRALELPMSSRVESFSYSYIDAITHFQLTFQFNSRTLKFNSTKPRTLHFVHIMGIGIELKWNHSYIDAITHFQLPVQFLHIMGMELSSRLESFSYSYNYFQLTLQYNS